MIKTENTGTDPESKRTWETPRLIVEGQVSEITARISGID